MENIILAEIAKEEYSFYGLRVDVRDYSVGDICSVSHQLYQDPMYDDNDELVYPLIEGGIYGGFYDAGELSGTCSVEVNADNITNAIEILEQYGDGNIYLIAGNNAECGNDIGELIISNAKVIAQLR